MNCFAKAFVLLTAVAAASVLTGCDADVRVDSNKGTAPAPAVDTAADAQSEEGGGFSLEIPGLGVDVKTKNGKVDVKAPGVDVRRDPATGTSVRAPGTEVDVDGAGVRVKAPNTDVKVE
ncbi:hypothetical protein Pla175_51570 [Pirellulimonas nuda]|uniref:Adhesin domain-containing protein n=1 Tax=Pirellulimonas nuda TaxID=2528009 RepID=A0A518DJS6_9BACT|nr:hypothetical protein [Pirellulimonas nuda]QDU91727.1 hypothetical protein Pla175_51570 [Pirellulimonas nuda]